MRIRIPKAVAQWVEENGYMMRLTPTLYFDIMAETLYIKRGEDWFRAKITPERGHRKIQIT